MRFPISLYVSMTGYLAGKKLHGVERFPLVLMLEPTHRCNLTCAGCGRIREYHDTLSQEMTLEDCITSIEEADAPVVTITGGEPLLYSYAPQLVQEALRQGRHIYFCTNGLLLEESLSFFRPNPRFTWNVHFDGTEPVHDAIIGKPGGFSKALAGVNAAKVMGFRVSTNTTVYRDSSVTDIAKLFRQLTNAGVDGILVAPGFSYEEVIGDVFLTRSDIVEKFREISTWGRNFPIISNPLYLEFVSGKRSLQCTPWGNPTRNSQGWKSPCYLITDTHYRTYAELMDRTDWDYYVSGADPRCSQCMVHCGFEPTIVRRMGFKDLLRMLRWNLDV
ncbi:MAG TPA: adenosyl-hopene transferase HpnH [Syntrophobacteraceae bacterium]|nr:adenosyl-hopene transferase HpnH [Syntrophobacteraceae bacterium]